MVYENPFSYIILYATIIDEKNCDKLLLDVFLFSP